MNHLTRNEGVTGSGVPLPDQLTTETHIPAQADGSHEALGALSVERMVQLSQLGQEVAEYILDGNAITVHASHIKAVAEAKIGSQLTEAEQHYLAHTTGRLKDRDGDGQVFVPLWQRKPVEAKPAAKGINSLKGNNFALYRKIDALLTKDARKAS